MYENEGRKFPQIERSQKKVKSVVSFNFEPKPIQDGNDNTPAPHELDALLAIDAPHYWYSLTSEDKTK